MNHTKFICCILSYRFPLLKSLFTFMKCEIIMIFFFDANTVGGRTVLLNEKNSFLFLKTKPKMQYFDWLRCSLFLYKCELVNCQFAKKIKNKLSFENMYVNLIHTTPNTYFVTFVGVILKNGLNKLFKKKISKSLNV